MTQNERSEMIALMAESLKECINVYEAEREIHGRPPLAGYDMSAEFSKESIKLKITNIRHELLLLERVL